MVKKVINSLKIFVNILIGSNFNAKPILLEIELTNHCNKKCTMCPNKKMLREKGYMDFFIFKKVIDQSIDTIWEYSFDIMGEPTMHPNFIEMINYVKNKRGKIALYTNMNYRDENINKILVSKKVDRVIVNAPSLDKDTYQRITKNGDYSLFIYNLLQIRYQKEKLKIHKPVVTASVLKMGIKNKNIDKIKMKKYFDRVRIVEPHNWAEPEGYKNSQYYKNKTREDRLRCTNLETTAAILWNGQVTTCCYDYEGKTNFGNVKDNTIKNIWNSLVFNRFKKHKANKLCNYCNKQMRSNLSFRNIINYIRGSI